jgi:catechol 2,3-dioxygenase-like lactoylglutathione lyase family enzyme
MERARVPTVFRILVEATDLEGSCRFYEALLGEKGRRVASDRSYFDCGPVILGVVGRHAGAARRRSPPAEAIYFATERLEVIHRRARRLGCLVPDLLHGDASSPMGEIRVRPWGERSFYAQDPSGNPLCFVDARSKFTGTRRQVAALRRSTGG